MFRSSFRYLLPVLALLICAVSFDSLADITGFCGERQAIDCRGVCGGPARYDDCGVCEGDGKTSYTTAQAGTVSCCPLGTPKGEGPPNDCGICGGSENQGKDDCGVCNGPGKTSYSTAQVGVVECCAPDTFWPEGVPNDCGICGGAVNEGKDDCGACNGPGKTSYKTAQGGEVQCCAPGTFWEEGVPNDCGICGGTPRQGKDDCGVCNGPGKTTYRTAQVGEVECCAPGTFWEEGVPNDCGICGGGTNEGKDDCGVCGGPGETWYNTAQEGAVQCCPPGTPLEEGVPNDCGICGGSANEGKDCSGGCFGSVEDVGCGCGNPGKSGCDNKCGSTKVLDCLGRCGGTARRSGCDNQCNSTAVNVGCGCGVSKVNGCCPNDISDCGCGVALMSDGCCPGSPRGGCDGECGSNAVDDGCGCGVECVQNCIWVAGVSGFNYKGSTSYTNSYHDVKEIPSCFRSKFESKCGHGFNAIHRSNFHYYNHPYASKLDLAGCATQATYNKMRSFLGAPDQSHITHLAGGGGEHFEWYMDDNCDYVASPNGLPLCGYAGISYSPISLIWSGLPDNEYSVVKFQLSNNPEEPYSIWKASDYRPLLVWDPEHTGQVTSAEQLFGPQAFGGKPSLKGEEAGEFWGNGYEALGSLDKNGDGNVSGSELAGIYLWFDKNKDAVVDEGEMKSPEEVRLDALYYRDAVRNEATGDLELKLGYHKKVGSSLVSGASVDWFGEGFANMAHALSALSAEAKKQDTAHITWPAQLEEFASDKGVYSFAPVTKGELSGDVSGYWFWFVVDGDKLVPLPGIFALQQSTDDGSVYGVSIVEAALEENDKKVRTVARTFLLSGEVAEDGVLKFQTYDSNGVRMAASSAKLNEYGTTMRGSTSQAGQIRGKTVGKPTSVEVEYEWYAIRVMSE